MDKRVFLALVMSVASIFSLTAQMSCDLIETDINNFMARQADETNDDCNQNARTWVDTLPCADLMDYVLCAEKLLYKPYSPYCQRVTYRALLARLLQNSGDDIALLRYRYQYEMLCRNNEGEAASDFVYYDASGEEHRLSDSRGKSVLLLFNDPTCEECAMLRRHLVTEREFCGMKTDDVVILVICPDTPTDEWREVISHYPTGWAVGYSEDAADVYDLRTLPSTYLLDDNQVVMQRNAHQYITDNSDY